MIRAKRLLFQFLIALLTTSYGATVGNLDSHPDLNLESHAPVGEANVYNEIKRADEKQLVEENAGLTRYLPSLSTSEFTHEFSTLIRNNRVRVEQKPDLPEPSYDLHSLYDDVVSSHTLAEVSLSVSPIISSARESTQNAINAAEDSASSVVESVLSTAGNNPSAIVRTLSAAGSTSSTVGSISYAAESTILVAASSNQESHELSLNAGQLAGIVVGVFLASSFSSILAVLYILRYRRRRSMVIHSTNDPPAEHKKQLRWPTVGNLRRDAITSIHSANTIASHRQISNEILPRIPPPTHQNPPVGPVLFSSPVSPGSKSDQSFPVSPLSEQHHSLGRDRSTSLQYGLFRNNMKEDPESEMKDAPPIKFTLARNTTQSGAQQIQVIRVNNQPPCSPSSNTRATQTFLSHGREPGSIASREAAEVQGSAKSMEKRAVDMAPMPSINTLSPPIIPLRFSSLNAYIGTQHQDSSSFHGNDGTFLLTTDDESVGPIPGSSQDHPESGSSHSSMIFHDPTQFDPSGLSQQPTSRFSMSSVQVSLDCSASSTSPVQPELSPLRPAPLSPSQIQSPVPRRANTAAKVGVPGTIYT
ncbi:hypothetical protein F5Y03DRAFT_285460 [Xylaria venustula]|nr:hypothetical protein F5Y03DRAFT_285460 [Xylaria venustula]